MQIRVISSLEKVFDDVAELNAPELASGIAAQGEVYSFQIAVKETGDEHGLYRVAFDGGLNARVRTVDSVPVHLAVDSPDAYYLRTTPGLYPDLLEELEDCDSFRILARQWRVLWVTVPVPAECKPGRYPFRFRFSRFINDEWAETGEADFELEVAGFALPEQELIRYEWFHSDALCAYYRVEPWSEEHWAIVERFARNAAQHGINALYTPLWTPPLDTEKNGERPTCQLLDIMYDPAGDTYAFDFGKLGRFLDMGLRLNFKRFGMSHLFTQWGAGFTPKIVCALPDGRMEKRFGWHVASDDPAYAEFLRALMPQLIAFLRGKDVADRCFFSISDEPVETQFESYSRAVGLVTPLLDGLPTVEALSRIEFYESGLVQHPVPADNHIEPFVGKVKDLWTYYCCGQQNLVPNRLMAMPSARNRIMGVLAYVYDLAGFLQWGFNFYYSQYSRRLIDPFACTDAGGAFPAGDAFLVYPGRNGEPLDSIRHEVFRDGLQDLRALKLLERKIGRRRVLEFLKQGRTEQFTMEEYPRDPEYLANLRPRIYAKLQEA
ncbi:MAG: DUF4091 domain-containing protein [Lentisphaeria bacterium]|nr:DUF4091 domain-containing protein [Lentisphaeria bacterium]